MSRRRNYTIVTENGRDYAMVEHDYFYSCGHGLSLYEVVILSCDVPVKWELIVAGETWIASTHFSIVKEDEIVKKLELVVTPPSSLPIPLCLANMVLRIFFEPPKHECNIFTHVQRNQRGPDPFRKFCFCVAPPYSTTLINGNTVHFKQGDAFMRKEGVLIERPPTLTKTVFTKSRMALSGRGSKGVPWYRLVLDGKCDPL